MIQLSNLNVLSFIFLCNFLLIFYFILNLSMLLCAQKTVGTHIYLFYPFFPLNCCKIHILKGISLFIDGGLIEKQQKAKPAGNLLPTFHLSLFHP